MDTVRTEKSGNNDLLKQTKRPVAVEIKGSVFTLLVLRLRNTLLEEIEASLVEHLSRSPEFFNHAPVVIDLELTKQLEPALDFSSLARLLRDHQLIPVGIQKASLEQQLEAERAGLAILTSPSASTRVSRETESAVEEDQSSSSDSEHAATQAVMGSKVVHQPIRGGQRVYARGSDLILLSSVNAGAEIMADGNIHIYAPMRGRALAGVSGDAEARIFCHSLEAELVGVAGHYRVFEDRIPESLYKKSVQIYLEKEQLCIEPI